MAEIAISAIVVSLFLPSVLRQRQRRRRQIRLISSWEKERVARGVSVRQAGVLGTQTFS